MLLVVMVVVDDDVVEAVDINIFAVIVGGVVATAEL